MSCSQQINKLEQYFNTVTFNVNHVFSISNIIMKHKKGLKIIQKYEINKTALKNEINSTTPQIKQLKVKAIKQPEPQPQPEEPATTQNPTLKNIVICNNDLNIIELNEPITPPINENMNLIQRFKKFYKIPLKTTKPPEPARPDWKKTPAIKNWQDSKEQNINYRNYGIITGQKNNLIVLDIDFKDEGHEEFNKYVLEFGEPETLKISTPNKGLHYYFNYTNEDEYTQKKIIKCITNSSKYRGKGIDIRTDGGYIIGPGTKINNIEYVQLNNNNIVDIPPALVEWLLESYTDTTEKQPKTKNNKSRSIINNVDDSIKYIIHDDILKQILLNLTGKWLTIYSMWLKVLTAFKHLNKYDLFNEWSKQSPNYNNDDNLFYWDYNKGVIDINYLVIELNKTGLNLPYAEKVKELKEDETIKNNETTKEINFNNKYVFDENNDNTFNYKLFNEYDSIIIKSCTGTGKTTAISKHFKRYMTENETVKLLTITNKVSLSDQHLKSFTDENINLLHYKYDDLNNDENLTICINSLVRLNKDTEEINNTIIYIDEINSFLKLTHNSTLDEKMKKVFLELCKLIKNCKKIIVSDNTILNNVYEFLKHRSNNMLIVNNSYQKYKDVNAVRIRNEQTFLNKIIDQISNNEYFLFGCDSCKTVTGFYLKCLDVATEEQKQNFILITGDKPLKIIDASEQFKNKYVFYSPSITTGIDFTHDIKQNVFIYQLGGKKGSIDPVEVFQQTTRTRNIKTLYYYSESKEQPAKYETIEELKKEIIENIETNDKLFNYCCNVNDNDETFINTENIFFNLYLFNEYINDVYKTNRTIHYETCLINGGFKLSVLDEPQPINKEDKEEIQQLIDDVTEIIFYEYLEAEPDQRAANTKYNQLHLNIKYLNLHNETNEILIEFKDIITNKYKIQDHDNIIKLLKSNHYLETKTMYKIKDNFKIMNVNNIITKINLLRRIEKQFKINMLDVEYNQNEDISINDDDYKLLKSVFRTTKERPTKTQDFKSLYISMIKNITCNEIISIIDGTTRKDRTRKYTLNVDLIKKHLKLNKFKNRTCTGFHETFIKQFDIQPDINDIKTTSNLNYLDNDLFIDDEETTTQETDIKQDYTTMTNKNESNEKFNILCNIEIEEDNIAYLLDQITNIYNITKKYKDSLKEPAKTHNDTEPQNTNNKITTLKNVKISF